MISTYAELKTAVASFLNRTDLTSIIPDLIRLGEQRIHYGGDLPFQTQPLRIPAMENQAAGTVSGTISFPTGFIQPISLIVDNGTKWALDYMTPTQFALKSNDSDEPTVYTYQNNNIEVAGTASISYTLNYYKAFTSLSADADTNWLLTNAPGVYLYASLLEAQPFLMDDARMTTWHSMLKSSISALNRSTNFQGGGLMVRAS